MPLDCSAKITDGKCRTTYSDNAAAAAATPPAASSRFRFRSLARTGSACVNSLQDDVQLTHAAAGASAPAFRTSPNTSLGA